MEKEFLSKCINRNLSISEISKETGVSRTSVSYWLKKHHLKTNHKSFKDVGIINYGFKKYCPRCNEDKLIEEFYDRRGKIGGSVYCKKCTGEQAIDRQRELKEKAITYKGGKCEICGYNKCNGALEFHHNDPTKKEFSISSLKRYSFNNKIKEELDKCSLLCTNCHREKHYK